MGLCQSDCADYDLIDNPDAGCAPLRRKRGLYKIGFYKCSTSLPDPLTCTNFETLVDSKAVVFSSPVNNADFADPETEETKIADCLPTQDEVVSRTLTFEDHIAVDVAGDSGANPAVVANLFADLKFWGNKRKISGNLRYVLLFCDGTMEVVRDSNKVPMAASFTAIRSMPRQGSGATAYNLEIKKVTIKFQGDPLELRDDYAPDLTITGATCETLAAKLGIAV